MRALSEAIANLNRVRAAHALLLHYAGDALARRKQECTDGRRNSCSNPSDNLVANDPGPAWHVRNQTQRGGSVINGEGCFVDTGDAADFYSRGVGGIHALPWILLIPVSSVEKNLYHRGHGGLHRGHGGELFRRRVPSFLS